MTEGEEESIIPEASMVMDAITMAGEININLIFSVRIHQVLFYVFHSLCSPF